jgi:hypothetical protein
MLGSIMRFIGREVAAEDGLIGTIDGFYFDDSQWAVRYFVVTTGFRSASKKKVLVAPDAFKDLERSQGSIATNLSIRQIKDSPDVDLNNYISIDHEEAMANYYHWPAYWDSIAVEKGYVTDTGGDSRNIVIERRAIFHNLRSMADIGTFVIDAIDGVIGKVMDAIVDETDWQVQYLIVEAEGERSKKVLISPDWLESIDWDNHRMRAAMSRDTVLNSPEYDPSSLITQTYRGQLHDYYGLPK